MSGLVITAPLPIADAMLTGTDVTEAEYTAWSGATTYALGDRVRVTTAGVHKVYESLAGSNLNNDPTLATLSTPTAWWIMVGPTNKWKLFDGSNSTATAKATSMYYEVTPGMALNTVYAGGLIGATSIRIRLTDPIYGVVYDTGVVSLSGLPPASDWWSFFFGAWTNNKSSVTFSDLPAFPNAVLRMDLTGDATLAIGVLLIGQGIEFGSDVQAGARTGITDYTQKTTNQWGDIVAITGPFAKRETFTLLLDMEEVDSIQDYLAAIRATPCLFVGHPTIGSLSVFGYYKSFENQLNLPDKALCEMTVEGLT